MSLSCGGLSALSQDNEMESKHYSAATRLARAVSYLYLQSSLSFLLHIRIEDPRDECTIDSARTRGVRLLSHFNPVLFPFQVQLLPTLPRIIGIQICSRVFKLAQIDRYALCVHV